MLSLIIRGDGPAALGGGPDQFAHASYIDVHERVVFQDVGPPVVRQEAASVVAADAEGSPGQVVGAEAEELRRLGDLRGSQGSARQLDQLVDLANAAGDLGC